MRQPQNWHEGSNESTEVKSYQHRATIRHLPKGCLSEGTDAGGCLAFD